MEETFLNSFSNFVINNNKNKIGEFMDRNKFLIKTLKISAKAFDKFFLKKDFEKKISIYLTEKLDVDIEIEIIKQDFMETFITGAANVLEDIDDFSLVSIYFNINPNIEIDKKKLKKEFTFAMVHEIVHATQIYPFVEEDYYNDEWLNYYSNICELEAFATEAAIDYFSFKKNNKDLVEILIEKSNIVKRYTETNKKIFNEFISLVKERIKEFKKYKEKINEKLFY